MEKIYLSEGWDAGGMETIGHFRRARGFWRWLLNRFDSCAITMPWGIVYVLEEDWQDDYGMQIHEGVHLCQIKTDGPILFTIKYLWWWLRYGYYKNPYEVEAYQTELGWMQMNDLTDYTPHTEPWL